MIRSSEAELERMLDVPGRRRRDCRRRPSELFPQRFDPRRLLDEAIAEHHAASGPVGGRGRRRRLGRGGRAGLRPRASGGREGLANVAAAAGGKPVRVRATGGPDRRCVLAFEVGRAAPRRRSARTVVPDGVPADPRHTGRAPRAGPGDRRRDLDPLRRHGPPGGDARPGHGRHPGLAGDARGAGAAPIARFEPGRRIISPHREDPARRDPFATSPASRPCAATAPPCTGGRRRSAPGRHTASRPDREAAQPQRGRTTVMATNDRTPSPTPTTVDRDWIATEFAKGIDAEAQMAHDAEGPRRSPRPSRRWASSTARSPRPTSAIATSVETVAIRYGHTPGAGARLAGGIGETLGRLKDKVSGHRHLAPGAARPRPGGQGQRDPLVRRLGPHLRGDRRHRERPRAGRHPDRGEGPPRRPPGGASTGMVEQGGQGPPRPRSRTRRSLRRSEPYGRP